MSTKSLQAVSREFDGTPFNEVPPTYEGILEMAPGPRPRAPRLPMGSSFTVRRTELVRSIVKHEGESGICVITAPDGFGKTALCLQYAEEVRSDPGRGDACLIDAAAMSCVDVIAAINDAACKMRAALRPAVIVDGIPAWSAQQGALVADRIRELRDEGVTFIVSCVPGRREFVSALGGAARIGAQALRVRPREYSDWARTFSLSSTLDVYALTQGIPSLVASLSAAVRRNDEVRPLLDVYIDELYRAVLAELAAEDEHMALIASMMLLLGTGRVEEIEGGGMRVSNEVLARLMHDYPVFGYDASTRAFSCLGAEDGPLREIRAQIARERPRLVTRACRMLLRYDRVDEAEALARAFMERNQIAAVIAQFPLKFALAGHAALVAECMTPEDAAGSASGPGGMLALYAAALTLGDFKLARAMAGMLRLQAQAVADEISASDWDCALALAGLWPTCSGIELPRIAYPGRDINALPAAADIRGFSNSMGRILGTARRRTGRRRPRRDAGRSVALDVPELLRVCGEIIEEIADGDMKDAPDDRDAQLEAWARVLRERRLVPILSLVRTSISMRRLFSGAPVTDERVFSDAGTLAIRVADQPFQLFCMLLEGWQSLALGQMVNAQFRGQQVLRLMGGSAHSLKGWALVLERTAHLRSSSRLAIREEAELLDLTQRSCTPAQAWVTAFGLAAARFDGELSAWYSLHKKELLDPSIRLPARLAMQAMGERADAIRRLLPEQRLHAYLLGGPSRTPRVETVLSAADVLEHADLGQLGIGLFGGFKVERNNHTITDAVWRRRKASTLAARLTLAMGSFVSRRVLMEELWPDSDYKHARDNLYATLTVLRRAMRQGAAEGPQYLLSHGDGVAINREYVVSDVMQFELLARQVLVKRTGVAAPQVIESCLKIEQIYSGDLYVPDQGCPDYFIRMRGVFAAKFVDCMLRGVEAAIDEEDLSSALWMVDAALRRAPTREDVIRAAMRVYDRGGRRNEVIELYHGHLHYLKTQVKGIPEPETRQLYEELIGLQRRRGLL